MTAGRPSKYSPAYCNEIIEHMHEGASIASFAALIGVARSTIQEWEATHPEFSVAVKIGKAKCAAWWEDRLRTIAKIGGVTGQATAVIFGLKNMAAEDWRETVSNEITGKNGEPLNVGGPTIIFTGAPPGTSPPEAVGGFKQPGD